MITLLTLGHIYPLKYPHNGKLFTEYLNKEENNCIISEQELSLEEFKKAFKTLKSNKANSSR